MEVKFTQINRELICGTKKPTHPKGCVGFILLKFSKSRNYFASETATAQATVIPTMGLLPIPILPKKHLFKCYLNNYFVFLDFTVDQPE